MESPPGRPDTRAEKVLIWLLGVGLSAVALYVVVAACWTWAAAAHSAWFGVRAAPDRGLAVQYAAFAVAPRADTPSVDRPWDSRHRTVLWFRTLRSRPPSPASKNCVQRVAAFGLSPQRSTKRATSPSVPRVGIRRPWRPCCNGWTQPHRWRSGVCHRQYQQRMSLDVGRRIRLSGGYDFEPAWLANHGCVEGVVAAWIPGQNEEPACVVALDNPITAEGVVRDTRREVTGRYAVLELRYEGAAWGDTGVVHVELCGEMPQPKAWPDRPVGAWVESHATYELV